MLLGNISRNNLGRGIALGGINSCQAGNRFKGGELFNWIVQDGMTTIISVAAIPAGYYPQATYYMPLVAGAMSCRATGSGTVSSAGMAGGYNLAAALTGSGDITNALLGLIVSMQANLTGSGDITTADLEGAGNLAAALTGSGTVTAATLTGKGNMVAALSGSGTITSTLNAMGNMSADIVSTGDLLTTANVGEAVWQQMLAAGYTADQLMKLFASVLGSKSDGFVAGTASTVHFRDTADSKNVVTANMDANGNRLSVTLNL